MNTAAATAARQWARGRMPGDTGPVGAHGFTLIEMMVVLTLIAIMSALILPEMKGSFEEEVLRGSARKMTAVLQSAYSQAVTLNQTQRLRIDRSTGRYKVERIGAADPTVSDRNPAPSGSFTEGALDRRITIEIRKSGASAPDEFTGENEMVAGAAATASGPDAILFYSDGTAERAEIVLRDRHGYGLVLRLNPITARVSIAEINRATAP